MRAMKFSRYGGPEVLEWAEAERPSPGAGEVLVQVQCSSVNPIDWKIASGLLRPLLPGRFPAIPGFDVSGVVEEVGPGVAGLAPGARVHARMNGGTGAASAEYAVVKLKDLARIPDSMTFGEAAALPLAGMTALQGLRDYCKVPMQGAQQRVLVVGASGGVGHFAVQIARAAGARVTGVCSERNASLVRELGAEQVINYARPDAWEGQGPWDVILDCVGGSPMPWLARLGPSGHLASCLPRPLLMGMGALNPLLARKVHAVMLKSNGVDLALLDGLYTSGRLKILVDQRFPLERLADAWTTSVGGRVVGKLVINVGGEV